MEGFTEFNRDGKRLKTMKKTAKDVTLSEFGHRCNELVDLQAGSHRRVDSALWDIKRHTEEIAKDGFKNAEDEIVRVKRDLAAVEQHLRAYRDYSAKLKTEFGL